MYSSYDAVQVLSLRGVVDFYIEDCSTRVCLLVRFFIVKSLGKPYCLTHLDLQMFLRWKYLILLKAVAYPDDSN